MEPSELSPDLLEFLRCFHNRGVRHLLIGGWAVIHHGYPRTTNDMDVWIAVDPVNAERVSAALVDHGFGPESVPPSTFAEVGMMFRFGVPPLRVELLTTPSGVEFEPCWAERVEVQIDGVPVPVISLERLKQNKLASGRLKDLADLDELPS